MTAWEAPIPPQARVSAGLSIGWPPRVDASRSTATQARERPSPPRSRCGRRRQRQHGSAVGASTEASRRCRWQNPAVPDTTEPALRLVLADDTALLRESLAQALRGAGFDVVGEAGDGKELLRLVEETQPDVALVDIR